MHIIPQRLRGRRNELQMSRAVLAAKSNVSEKQIQRLENPKQASRNVRPLTMNRLAKALDVEPQQLTREPPTPEDSKQVRIGAALAPGVRLAYELIERRYGVTVGQLLNVAPLFFALLAEGSLAWRRDELAELQAAIDRVKDLSDLGRKRFAFHVQVAEEDSDAEEQAIARAELLNDPLPADYECHPDEDWDGSPFADYLRKLADNLGRPELVDLDPSFHGRVSGFPGMPAYRIYSEDLTKIAPLESDAMYALHSGDAGFADIPDELMASNAGDARQRWLEAKLTPASREWLDTLQRIASQLKLRVDDDSEGGSDSGGTHGGDQ